MIIATITLALDVNQLAQVTGRSEGVVVMHFFSPAHVMQLLEVVRGWSTPPDVLHAVGGVGQKIRKVSVVSGHCWEFIGTRMLKLPS